MRVVGNAADVRRDDVWRNLQSYQVDEPMGSYHRRCYQTYTHRKTLQRIASRHLGASQDPDASKSSDSENSDTQDDEEMSRACSRKTRNKVAWLPVCSVANSGRNVTTERANLYQTA